MVRRSGKNLKHLCIPTLAFVRHQSIFRATQKFLNQYTTYIYIQQELFFVNMSSFSL